MQFSKNNIAYSTHIYLRIIMHFCFFDISPEGRATTGCSAKPGQPVGQVKQASDHVPVLKNWSKSVGQ